MNRHILEMFPGDCSQLLLTWSIEDKSDGFCKGWLRSHRYTQTSCTVYAGCVTWPLRMKLSHLDAFKFSHRLLLSATWWNRSQCRPFMFGIMHYLSTTINYPHCIVTSYSLWCTLLFPKRGLRWTSLLSRTPSSGTWKYYKYSYSYFRILITSGVIIHQPRLIHLLADQRSIVIHRKSKK